MKFPSILLAATVGLASTAHANPATFHPQGQKDISYSVAIPDATSTSHPIFIQLKSPSSLSWVGIGQGSSMRGANMFLMYTSSSGRNVTLSPRSGIGHTEPKTNPSAQVTLLDGSSAADGTMTANFRCDNCLNWKGGSLDPSSSSSSWIFAYKAGPPLGSDDASESISFHDSFGHFSIDPTKARVANNNRNNNPFATFNPPAMNINAVSLDEGGGGSLNTRMLIAHGFLMAFAFGLFFPVFALLVPLPIPISVAKVHAPLQLFTLAMAIAGMGLGLKMATNESVMRNEHPIIGIIVVGLLILFQPLMGFLQHRRFKATGQKGPFAYAHRWLGRTVIILGIINGGLGFRLAGVGNPGTPRGAMIAYAVIAGVVGATYILVQVVMGFMGGGRERLGSDQEDKVQRRRGETGAETGAGAGPEGGSVRGQENEVRA